MPTVLKFPTFHQVTYESFTTLIVYHLLRLLERIFRGFNPHTGKWGRACRVREHSERQSLEASRLCADGTVNGAMHHG